MLACAGLPLDPAVVDALCLHVAPVAQKALQQRARQRARCVKFLHKRQSAGRQGRRCERWGWVNGWGVWEGVG